MIEKSIHFIPPEPAVSAIRYAAAFIHPSVRDISIEGETWRFSLSEDVDTAVLEKGVGKLADRFRAAADFDPEPVFVLDAPADFGNAAKEAPLTDEAFQRIHPGLYIFREPLSKLTRFLDAELVRRYKPMFDASEEVYPNCIPVSSLAASQHLSSFPEHLHFLTHLPQDLDVLDDFATMARAGDDAVDLEEQPWTPVELVNNPSTCYHCYAARKDTTISENVTVTAITKCHRFEAANHKEFGRLLEFSQREFIFLGYPDYVRARRDETLRVVRELATEWRLYGELVQSNDPFFTSDFSAKANQQQRMDMKYEYRMAVPGQTKKLSVLSSNLHGMSFGKSFRIKRPGGPLHTGCIGFGVERLALCIIAQHGAEPKRWPDKLAERFFEWDDRGE